MGRVSAVSPGINKTKRCAHETMRSGTKLRLGTEKVHSLLGVCALVLPPPFSPVRELHQLLRSCHDHLAPLRARVELGGIL